MGQRGLAPFGSERRLSLSGSPRSHHHPRINNPESLFQHPEGSLGLGEDPGPRVGNRHRALPALPLPRMRTDRGTAPPLNV